MNSDQTHRRTLIRIVLSYFEQAVFPISLPPAEGGDPSAQLHVAVRAEVIAADKQLHCVIPLGAG